MGKYEVKAFPLYHEKHFWVRKMPDGMYKIGVTDYAQSKQGSIVYADLPSEGDTITKDETYGSVESSKAVSDLIAPVSGTVAAVNEEVLDSPGIINDSCYDSGWLIAVEPSDWEGESAELMNADAYTEYLDTL